MFCFLFMPHGHHGVLHLLKNRELNELYAAISIRTFAMTLAGIFIPIYLYQIGYSFQSIFLFFAWIAFFNLLSLFPTAKVVSKYGLKHSMLFSMPPLIIFFLMLYSLEIFNWPLWTIAIFGGICTSLYWLAYHTDFVHSSEKKSRGKQIGLSRILMSSAGAIAPLVGGLILTAFGFKVLFIITSLLLLVSTFPLFMSKEIHEPAKFSFQNFFQGHKLRNISGYMGFGIENRLAAVIWPLFIFVFILEESYLTLGGISTAVFAFTVISTLAISKSSDINRRKVLKTGSVFTAIIWFAKSFIVTPLQVFIVDSLQGVSRSALHIPFDAINYDKAKEGNRIKKILEREVYIKIGATVFMVLVAFLAEDLISVFRFAGPLSALMHFFF